MKIEVGYISHCIRMSKVQRSSNHYACAKYLAKKDRAVAARALAGQPVIAREP